MANTNYLRPSPGHDSYALLFLFYIYDVLHAAGGLHVAVAVLSVFSGLCLVVLAVLLMVFRRRRTHLRSLTSRQTSQQHNYEAPSMPVCFRLLNC